MCSFAQTQQTYWRASSLVRFTSNHKLCWRTLFLSWPLTLSSHLLNFHIQSTSLHAASSGPFPELQAPASWQVLDPAEKAQQRAPFSHCQAEWPRTWLSCTLAYQFPLKTMNPSRLTNRWTKRQVRKKSHIDACQQCLIGNTFVCHLLNFSTFHKPNSLIRTWWLHENVSLFSEETPQTCAQRLESG